MYIDVLIETPKLNKYPLKSMAPFHGVRIDFRWVRIKGNFFSTGYDLDSTEYDSDFHGVRILDPKKTRAFESGDKVEIPFDINRLMALKSLESLVGFHGVRIKAEVNSGEYELNSTKNE